MNVTIWLVRLKTTGENWHICVCASLEGVMRVLTAHGIDERTYGHDNSDFQEWQSTADKSQTATIMRQVLIP